MRWVALFLLVAFFCLIAQNYYRTHGYRTKRNNEEHIHALVASGEVKDYATYLLYYDPIEYRREITDRYCEDCAKELEELAQYNPAVYYFIQGSMHESEGHIGDAKAAYEKCLEYYDPNEKNDIYVAKMYGRCCYRLGIIYRNKGDYEAMKSYFDIMAAILKEQGAMSDLVNNYINIVGEYYEIEDGTTYATALAEEMVNLGNAIEYDDKGYMYYVAALAYGADGNSAMFINYIMEALDEYIENGEVLAGEEYNACLCLISIGHEYLTEKNYDPARGYLLEAYGLEIADDTELNAEIKAYVLQNLTDLEIRAGNLEDAGDYLSECAVWLEYENRINAESDRVVYRGLRAEYLCALGEYEEALEYLEEAYLTFTRCQSFEYANYDITIYVDYGNVYYGLKDYETALTYYMSAKALTEFRGLSNKDDYLRGICNCYSAMEDYPNALHYGEVYREYLNNQLMAAQSTQSAFFEYMNNQQSNTIVKLENVRGRMFVVIMAAVSGLLVLTFLTIQIRNKKKQIEVESENFHKLSEVDGLTGLYNRRSLDEYMQKHWAEHLKSDKSVAVVMADVDHFKKYNDHYGHQMGDDVLVAVADTLKSSCRKDTDFIARYGGEEFLIVLPDITKELLKKVLLRIEKTLEEKAIPHEASPVSDILTISIGAHICSKAEEEKDYEYAIKQADNALYKAKEKRNCYVIDQ